MFDEKMLCERRTVFDEKILCERRPVFDEKMWCERRPVFDEKMLWCPDKARFYRRVVLHLALFRACSKHTDHPALVTATPSSLVVPETGFDAIIAIGAVDHDGLGRCVLSH